MPRQLGLSSAILLVLVMVLGSAFPGLSAERGKPEPRREERRTERESFERRSDFERNLDRSNRDLKERLQSGDAAAASRDLQRSITETTRRINDLHTEAVERERLRRRLVEMKQLADQQRDGAGSTTRPMADVYRQRSEAFDYSTAQRESKIWKYEGGKVGGHTLIDHTPRDPRNLRTELKQAAARRQSREPVVSMYRDVPTADRTIARNIDANRPAIEAWAAQAETGRTKSFDYRSPEPIGEAYNRITDQYASTRDSRVVAIRTTDGWSVYTSYPVVE